MGTSDIGQSLLHSYRYLLQCVALCCRCVAVCVNVLQCAAVCCSVLQRVAVCCSVLQWVAVCCSALQCVAVCCSVLQCVAVCCSVRQYRVGTACMSGQKKTVIQPHLVAHRAPCSQGHTHTPVCVYYLRSPTHHALSRLPVDTDYMAVAHSAGLPSPICIYVCMYSGRYIYTYMCMYIYEHT